MKLIFCVILGLILSNSNFIGSSEIGAAHDLEEAFVHETIHYARESLPKRVQEHPPSGLIARFLGKNLEKSNDADNKTKFASMNLDCVFVILERLNFDDLLSVARVNDQLSRVAASVFRFKYSRLQVVIRDDFEFPKKSYTNPIARILQRLGILSKKEEKKYYVHESDTAILLADYDSIVHTFKYFGHVIKRLKLLTSNKLQYSKEEFIGNLVTKYISDSLIEIWFDDSNDQLLTYIAKPLVNVETVRFYGNILRVVPKGLPLNELFPAVRRIEWNTLEGDGLSYFNCHLPHLQHCSIKGVDLNSESSFVDFIMNNPQIKSIELYNDYPEFVKMVSVHLPQLETLSLSHFRLSSGSIRFENVTTFHANLHYGSLKNLHFPKLEMLRTYYNSHRFDEFRDFLNEHNHLQHLHLKHYCMDDAHFQQLTAIPPDVTEMTLENGSGRYDSLAFSFKAIMEFLKSHNKLMQLNVINLHSRRKYELQELLKHEWNIKMNDLGLSLERKTNN